MICDKYIIESNYYQNKTSFLNLEKKNNSHIQTDYAPQVVQNSSSMNNLYQISKYDK